jgi:hypothetical protein
MFREWLFEAPAEIKAQTGLTAQVQTRALSSS